MANEYVSNVAGYENALCTQISPIERQVREIDAPILYLLLDVGLKAEVIHPTGFAREKALVVSPVVFIGDPTVDGKKLREEG
jgi:hypothetical protein